MSLRLTLIAGIFSLMLLTLAAGIAAVYMTAGDKLETEMASAVRIGGRMMNRAVETIGPPFTGQEVLERLIATFDGDRHVRAVLIGPHGVVLASSKPQEPERPAPRWFLDLFLVEPKLLAVELPPVFEGVGALVLQSAPENEMAEVWEDATRTLALLSGLCGLTLLLVFWQLKLGLKPLDALSAAFLRVGDAGRLPRVVEAGPSEIVHVARGYNDMADRLERSEAQNRRLNMQLADVQEEERAELARDLHDEFGPFLFAMDVDAKAIETAAAARGDTETTARIAAIRETLARLRRTVRELLARLRPAVLLDLGLAHAIEHLAAFWRGRQPAVEIVAAVDEEETDEAVSAAIYRVVQESLSNAMRHGSPGRVDVRVRSLGDGRVEVTITDDGVGLAVDRGADALPGSGLGIAGMHERVKALGGTFEVAGRADGRGSGTVVRAVLPTTAEAASVSSPVPMRMPNPSPALLKSTKTKETIAT
ncbi:MAG: histidine kinase [Hyphomicrobiaceae bacterium]|nr:histidine kinase [Hyphomicrobiaceae bacterium]